MTKEISHHNISIIWEKTDKSFTCSNHFYHGCSDQYGQDDSDPVHSIAVVVLFSRILPDVA